MAVMPRPKKSQGGDVEKIRGRQLKFNLRLLEIYASRKNAVTFETLASECMPR